MNVLPNVLTSDKQAGASSFNTASIIPHSQRLILVSVIQYQSPGTANAPSVSGCGLTWTQVATITADGGALRVTLFRAMGSPAAGVLTLTFGGQTQTQVIWSVVEFQNVSVNDGGVNTVVQSTTAATANSNEPNTLSLTLSAFSNVHNATYVVIGSPNPAALSGFTREWLLITPDPTLGGPDSTGSGFFLDGNQTSLNLTWSGSGSGYGAAIAVEIKYALYGGAAAFLL